MPERDRTVGRCVVVVLVPDFVFPQLRPFSQHISPQSLQNIKVVEGLDGPTRSDEFIVDNTRDIEKISTLTSHYCDFDVISMNVERFVSFIVIIAAWLPNYNLDPASSIGAPCRLVLFCYEDRTLKVGCSPAHIRFIRENALPSLMRPVYSFSHVADGLSSVMTKSKVAIPLKRH